MTLKEIDDKIKELRKKYDEYCNENEDYYIDHSYATARTPYDYEIAELNFLRRMTVYTEDIQPNNYGYLVNKRYIITRTGRWRVKGKNKWYWYKDIEDLFERYINKPRDYQEVTRNE